MPKGGSKINRAPSRNSTVESFLAQSNLVLPPMKTETSAVWASVSSSHSLPPKQASLSQKRRTPSLGWSDPHPFEIQKANPAKWQLAFTKFRCHEPVSKYQFFQATNLPAPPSKPWSLRESASSAQICSPAWENSSSLGQ